MPWARIDDQFPDHPKVVQAGPIAGWLHVCAICYSARLLTDGFIPSGQVRKLADIENVTDAVTALLTSGLWEKCDGGYIVHDYLDYNPSAEQVKAQRKANAERQARFRDKNKGTDEKSQHYEMENNGVTNGVSNSAPYPNPVPYPNTHPKGTYGESSCSDSDEPNEAKTPRYLKTSTEYLVAEHLAYRIHDNNPMAKPTTERQLQSWANEVRLMVERDGRRIEDVSALLDWSQSDSFWRANVLSMGALRKQFDRLTLEMNRPARASPNGHPKTDPLAGIREFSATMDRIEGKERPR